MSYCSLRHLLECLGYFGVFLSWEARQFLLWLSAGDRQAEMFFLFISLIHSEASQLQTSRLRRAPPTHCWCSTSRWRLTWNVSGIFKSTKTKMNRNRDIVRVKRKNKHKTFSSFTAITVLQMKKKLQVPNETFYPGILCVLFSELFRIPASSSDLHDSRNSIRPHSMMNTCTLTHTHAKNYKNVVRNSGTFSLLS